jgi:endonuclease/exonuclease/phosphatase (EEP) superfamily protein YafD
VTSDRPRQRRLCSGITASIVLLGGLTLLGFLDRWTPYLELATFFRLQYAILLGAAALAAITLRLFPVALAALALAAVNLVVIAPGGVSSSPAQRDLAQLRLLVLNVQTGNHEYAQVASLIARTDPDVVGLTELTPAWANGLRTALEPYRSRRLEPQDGAYGIGLYSKLPLAAAGIERFPADGPPTVVATVTVAGEPVDLVLTHVHTPFAGAIHDRQLQALGEARPRLGSRLAVCGDFNAVPWSGPLRHFADTTELRTIHGGYGLGGTWPAGAAVLRLPIDNCLISEGLTALDRRVGPNVGSDHLPLIVELGLAPGSGVGAPDSPAR